MRAGDPGFPLRPGSRRDLLRAGALAAGGITAVLLPACGEDDEPERPAGDAGGGPGDAEVLARLLDLEYAAVAAYAGLGRRLRGDARAAGRVIAGQEEEHANGVAQAIRDLGETPVDPRPDAEYAEELGLAEVRGADAALRLALRLENRAIAACIEALPELTSGSLRGMVAAIVTSEAEHLSLLLDALGREPAPRAFVTGRS